MTLQNEEAMLKTLKSMINKLNRPVHYVSTFTEKLFVLYIWLVFYLTLKKLKYQCLHNKVAFLMRRRFE